MRLCNSFFIVDYIFDINNNDELLCDVTICAMHDIFVFLQTPIKVVCCSRPLVFCAVKIYIGEVATLIDSIISDTSYAAWDCYAFKR